MVYIYSLILLSIPSIQIIQWLKLHQNFDLKVIIEVLTLFFFEQKPGL